MIIIIIVSSLVDDISNFDDQLNFLSLSKQTVPRKIMDNIWRLVFSDLIYIFFQIRDSGKLSNQWCSVFRSSPSRKSRSSRERKRKRRTPPSSPPKQQRERGPKTPPLSHRTKKRWEFWFILLNDCIFVLFLKISF